MISEAEQKRLTDLFCRLVRHLPHHELGLVEMPLRQQPGRLRINVPDQPGVVYELVEGKDVAWRIEPDQDGYDVLTAFRDRRRIGSLRKKSDAAVRRAAAFN